MKYLVSVVFWLISLTLWSQNQYVPNLFSKDSLRFFIHSNNLKLIFDNSVVTKKGEQFEITNLYIDQKKTFDKQLKWNKFNFLKEDQSFYFVRRNLGEVFAFENDSLRRVDRSSNLLSNTGSIQTLYNGFIYSLFGYGFFDTTNLAVIFGSKIKEWNKIEYPLSTDIPEPRRSPFFEKIGSQIYFFNGTSNFDRKNSCFIFDLDSKEYKKIGVVDESFPFSNDKFFQNVSLTDHKKLYQIDGLLLLVDFKNLTYAITDNLNAIDLTIAIGANLVGDKIYFLKPLNKNEFYLESINLAFIESSFGEFKPILKTSFFNLRNASILLILFIAVSLFIIIIKFINLRKLKNTKVLKQANYLTLKNELLILSQGESELLEYLILNPLSSMSALYSISSFSEYTDYYKKQVFSKTLEELTIKLNESQNIQEFISISKRPNPKDKRAVDVEFKGEVIIYKGWLKYLFTV